MDRETHTHTTHIHTQKRTRHGLDTISSELNTKSNSKIHNSRENCATRDYSPQPDLQPLTDCETHTHTHTHTHTDRDSESNSQKQNTHTHTHTHTHTEAPVINMHPPRAFNNLKLCTHLCTQLLYNLKKQTNKIAMHKHPPLVPIHINNSNLNILLSENEINGSPNVQNKYI